MKPYHYFLCIIGYLLFATHASAASLRVTSEQSPEGFIVATVSIDTQDTTINGFSGTLLFEDENLSLVAIDTIDSVVGVWVERPEERARGEIRWSGLTPGGFGGVRSPFTNTSAPGDIFRAVFRATEQGPIGFSFRDPLLYRNDGNGTEIIPTTLPASFVIEKTTSANAALSSEPVPQSATGFEAFVDRNDEVANNKWFVAFTTDTNRVSIKHYQIAEYHSADSLRVPESQWREAESPYILRKQSRSTYIHIRAIAFDGTVYTKTIAPVADAKYSTPLIIILWSILILLVALAFMRKQKRLR